MERGVSRRGGMHHGCHCFIMAEQLQGLPYTLLHLPTAHQHNHIIISQSHHHKIIISSYVSFKNKMVMVEILMMDMKEIRQGEVGERGGVCVFWCQSRNIHISLKPMQQTYNVVHIVLLG